MRDFSGSSLFSTYGSHRSRGFPKVSPISARESKIYIGIYIYTTMLEEFKVEKDILHYPNLETVLMVENIIRENSGTYRKKALWEHLPRKVMYQTFTVIIEYLLYSGKIAIDKEEKIAWIHNPSLVKKYLARSDLKA